MSDMGRHFALPNPERPESGPFGSSRARLDGMNDRLDRMEIRLERIDGQLYDLNGRLARVETGVLGYEPPVPLETPLEDDSPPLPETAPEPDPVAGL